MPAAAGTAGSGGERRCTATQLRDRRAVPFVTGVADYDVSADGHKLLYRTGGGGGGGGRGGAAGGGRPGAVHRRRRSHRAAGGHRAASTPTLRAYVDPKAEFKQIFDEAWRNQRDYLYVPNMHGADWPKVKQMYGAAAAVRECIAPISTT